MLARGFRARLAALRLRTQDSLCSSAYSLRNGCFQTEIRFLERILAQRGDDPFFILKFHPHAGLHVPAIADGEVDDLLSIHQDVYKRQGLIPSKV